MSIYKACDIRGRYGFDLTDETAMAIGRAIGSELSGRTVVVGGDVRPSTGPLKKELINGLTAAGSRVLDVGVLPTPAFYFARDHLRAEGGVMVTGSHNPPDDNGFKIILGKTAITEAEIESLKKRIEEKNFISEKGSCKHVEIIKQYKDFLKGRFSIKSGLKVVLDAGNGCYSHIAPEVLQDCGCEVATLFCEPDGSFPNRPPNPAVASNLKELCQTVSRTKADAGVAYDGDGDRVVFVDELGMIVESDVSSVLFARHFLKKRHGGTVVCDIKCSSAVAEEVQKAGGTAVIERSGHSFIRNTLMQRKAVFGGEVSGHFFFGELGRDDGLYATLLMLQITGEDGRGLAAMSESVNRYPITPDIRIPCPRDKALEILSQLQKSFSPEKEVEMSTLDGIRIAWPDGWMLARISVTEPLITLRCEAHTEQRIDEIREAVVSRVPQLKQLMESYYPPGIS